MRKNMMSRYHCLSLSLTNGYRPSVRAAKAVSQWHWLLAEIRVYL